MVEEITTFVVFTFGDSIHSIAHLEIDISVSYLQNVQRKPFARSPAGDGCGEIYVGPRLISPYHFDRKWHSMASTLEPNSVTQRQIFVVEIEIYCNAPLNIEPL